MTLTRIATGAIVATLTLTGTGVANAMTFEPDAPLDTTTVSYDPSYKPIDASPVMYGVCARFDAGSLIVCVPSVSPAGGEILDVTEEGEGVYPGWAYSTLTGRFTSVTGA